MTFQTIEDDIKKLLAKDRATRNDDMYLYAVYVLSKAAFVPAIFLNPEYRYKRGIAPYESVSRVRRMVQEKYPELKATKEQIKEKKRREKEYRNYARRNKGIEALH